ncbi:MAG: DUF4188 domain-containing protein [Symploca sp. SIO2E6]|nr:DUF4188 domain-containing protein [Symploca sp. SIO2E6]
MKYPMYQIELPETTEAVAFVNGIEARDFTGFLWMWKNMNWIKTVTTEAEGCVQVKAGICSPKELIMVSYWHSEKSLKQFFRGKPHQQMMQFVAKNPLSLCLYNEIYQPPKIGKYVHEPQGMAKLAHK